MVSSQSVRVFALLTAICLACLPSFSQNNLSQAEKREQERQLKEHFLNKTVIAKITMPMTTSGVQVSWDRKKGEWLISTNGLDLQRWGVGVKAGEKYGITGVYLSRGGIVFSVNDGGSINSATKLGEGLKHFGGGLNQIKHNQKVQQKRTSANGSRVTIITYNLKDANDLLAIAKEQTAKVFEITGSAATPGPSGESNPPKGTLLVSTEPSGVEIWVDESFMGQTPAKLTLLPGKHKIRLALQTYEEWSRETEVGLGSEANLKVALRRTSP